MPEVDATHLKLRKELMCLHCWQHFAPEDVLWISEHPELLGDPILGAESQLRFLPARFTVQGDAIDPRGQVCGEIACPKCHLLLPRALLEYEPLLVSIVGTPTCGKSYYLGALTWSLRRTLPQSFKLEFTDTDPSANQLLHRYFYCPLIFIESKVLWDSLFRVLLSQEGSLPWTGGLRFGVRSCWHRRKYRLRTGTE